MTSRDLALKVALLKVLTAELSAAKRTADYEVRAEWRPKDRITATLADDKEVATVTLASGRTTARLSDEAAFEDWVKATHPGRMTTVTMTFVDPDFQERLLAAARKLGAPVDAETGEIVPGVEVVQGEPYPMVKLAENARQVVAEAWRDGSLAELLPGLLAIEGGEES